MYIHLPFTSTLQIRFLYLYGSFQLLHSVPNFLPFIEKLPFLLVLLSFVFHFMRNCLCCFNFIASGSCISSFHFNSCICLSTSSLRCNSSIPFVTSFLSFQLFCSSYCRFKSSIPFVTSSFHFKSFIALVTSFLLFDSFLALDSAALQVWSIKWVQVQEKILEHGIKRAQVQENILERGIKRVEQCKKDPGPKNQVRGQVERKILERSIKCVYNCKRRSWNAG